MKKIISLVLMIFVLCDIVAQNIYEVKGKVIDLHNNTPLKEATVVLGKHTVITNDKGSFVFPKVEKGEYSIVVTHVECADYNKNISVNKNMNLTIAIEHHEKEIEDIKILGITRASNIQKVNTIQEKELNKNLQENIGNLLSSISGVSTLKTGNSISKPILRGLYGSRISILSDGVKLAEQEWGVEHAPSIEASMFQKISVVKGAGALKYSGNATGGVVILEEKPLPNKDTLMGNVQIVGFTNGKGLKTATQIKKAWENKWFVASGGSFAKRGDIAIPKHTLQNTASQEQSFNISAGKKNFEKGFEISYKSIYQDFGIFSGSHLSTASILNRVIQSGGAKEYYDNFSYSTKNPKQEVAHHIAKIEAYHRFKTIGKFNISYAFQWNKRKEYDIRRGELNQIPSLDLQLKTHQGKITHNIEREKWSLENAISAEYQDNFADPSTQTRRIIPDYKQYTISAYSVWEKHISEKWLTEIAARYDFSTINAYKYYDKSVWNAKFARIFPQFEVKEYGSRILTNPILNFHNYAINAGIRYSPTNTWSIKSNIAQVSRMPNPAELFSDGLHHSAAIVERGDLTLKAEKMTQINAIIRKKINLLKGIEIQISPYFYWANNYIQQIPTGIQNSNRGAFVIWSYQQVKAQIMGLEADVNINLSDKIQINSSYHWLKGDNITHSEPLILMTPPRLRTELSWILWKKKKITMDFAYTFVQKQNRFPIRNIPFETIENGQIQSLILDISTPPSAYQLFDVSIGADISKKINVYFKISNVFNTEYRDYLNRLRFYAPEMGRNLSLTLQYKF